MKKRLVGITMALVMLLSLFPLAAFAGSGLSGTGTVSDPYLIYDYEDLLTFADLVNNPANPISNTGLSATVKADILKPPAEGDSFAYMDMTPIGTEARPYKGTFTSDNDVSIKYLRIETASSNHVGLFGYIQNATIKNVTLSDPLVVGNTDVGALVGVAINSSITDCTVKSSRDRGFEVRGSESVGGLVGRAEDSSITGCKNFGWVFLLLTGEEEARHKLGGIVGVATLTASGTNPLLIYDCQNEGPVECTTVNDYECTGGIVGRLVSENANYRAKIDKCINNACVWSIEAGTGGIVGYAQNASIERCENKQAITGTTGVGGIAGYAFYGTQILNCTNSGSVTGNPYSDNDPENPKSITPFNIGGIVGSVYNPRDTSHLFENGELNCDVNPVYSYNRDSLIYDCSNSGTVTCNGDYEEQLGTIVCLPSAPDTPYAVQLEGSTTGGIVGFAADSAYFDEEGNIVKIEKCTNSGAVTGASSTGNATYTGGVLGCGKNVAVVESQSSGTVTNASDSSTDSVNDYIGGYCFTVRFNTNGGTAASGESLALTQNDLLLCPTEPTRTGFEFKGWYKDARLTEAFSFTTDKITAPSTLYADWEQFCTLTVPFTVTVRQDGNLVPEKTEFSLEFVDVNTGEDYYRDVTVSASVETNGAGSYSGTMTLTGPYTQLWYMLSEGAFVKQVNDGKADWSYDDTAWALLLRENPSLASFNEDTASAYSLLVFAATCETTENGPHYDFDLNGTPAEEMSFTNIYSKSDSAQGDNPKTGDSGKIALWLILLGVSATAVAVLGVYAEKRRLFSKHG